jgi:glycosyltransferase involved in cell wall biosynthesis
MLRQLLPARTALVVQDHGSRVDDIDVARPIPSLRQAVRRAALRAPDGFLFTAREQADDWLQAGLMSWRQRVYEVLEASTTLREVPRDAARALTGGGGGSPAALWVGRLNDNKDPLTVLDGFERAVDHIPQATLTMIYASDDLLPAVRERVLSSAALGSRVRLVGRVPHTSLAAFYSAADIFVLGSRHEGSGYALLEACACGAIPVVTDIPSFRAITARGSIGALWGPGDANGLTRALLEVANRDLNISRMRVTEHFNGELSWPVVGRNAMRIYREVVRPRHAAVGLAS